ncbi:MAG: glycoside hydrolase family 3 protein [Anaerolineae bacterium]
MKLTLDQAIGAKLMLSFAGIEPPSDILVMVRKQHVGGVTLFRSLNVVAPAQVRALTGVLQRAAVASGQPPLLIAADQEGGQLMAIGDTTPFPGNMALGATGSIDLARKTGRALGRELAAMGVNVNYAPVCDVNNNPQNPVIGIRSFGEDPAMVARFCAAMVEGLQSSGVAATAKHFPGHGDTSGDSHHGMPVEPRDRERLEQVEIPPFAAAIEANVRLVMTTHVAFPNLNEGVALPSTLSPALLEGLLREELGFRGVIVSDAMNMAAIRQGSGLVVDALSAVAAGVDLLLLVGDMAVQRNIYSALLQATERTLLSPAKMMSSAGRVLTLKQWLAAMLQPSLDVVGCAEHRDLALETAARSITLVRDEADLLPLRLSSDARLAVVVPQPVDLTPADTSSYVTCTLAQALRHYHPSVDEFVVSHAPSDADIAALRQKIGEYDTVIVGTINASMQSNQAAMVKALLDTGVPTIVVALRLPYDLQAYPNAPTYLCTYSVLAPSMDALAGVLWGDIPFKGRLPVSIPGMYPIGHGVDA